MICIYHSKDLDGFCSGAIVQRRYPDARLVGYDYGQNFPLTDDELSGEDVIMIDVSLPMKEMFVLALKARHLTWIDHHVSAISDYNNFPPHSQGGENITAILQNGIAACEIAWHYFFEGQDIPAAVKLLGEYDTWRNDDKERWDNIILPFQYGMRLNCTSAETFPEELFTTEELPIRLTIEVGRSLLEYEKMQNERLCKSAFQMWIYGHSAICVNKAGTNSTVFDSIWDEKKYDIMIGFAFNGKLWVFTLFTTKDDVDCSAIAKNYGGGGHRKAAGFQLKSLHQLSDIPEIASLICGEILKGHEQLIKEIVTDAAAEARSQYQSRKDEADWFNNNTPGVGQTVDYMTYPALPDWVEKIERLFN